MMNEERLDVVRDRGEFAETELWRLMVRCETERRGFCGVLDRVLPGVDALWCSPAWRSVAVSSMDEPIIECLVRVDD